MKISKGMAVVAGAALFLLGAVRAEAATALEAQEIRTGIHALKCETGVYLMEHVLRDYLSGAFLTVNDGRIIFSTQLLKDGQLLMEPCFVTQPDGKGSEVLALEVDEWRLPRFRRLEPGARTAELKALLDAAYARARQAEEEARRAGR